MSVLTPLTLVVHVVVAWLITVPAAQPQPRHHHGRGIAGDCVPVVGPQLPVWSCIDPPARTKYVEPLYPDEARRTGAHGVVILELWIDAWGRVVDVRTLRSVPLLDAAAIAAARQWTYRRTCLDGRAVAVAMTVSVPFDRGARFDEE